MIGHIKYAPNFLSLINCKMPCVAITSNNLTSIAKAFKRIYSGPIIKASDPVTHASVAFLHPSILYLQLLLAFFFILLVFLILLIFWRLMNLKIDLQMASVKTIVETSQELINTVKGLSERCSIICDVSASSVEVTLENAIRAENAATKSETSAKEAAQVKENIDTTQRTKST